MQHQEISFQNSRITQVREKPFSFPASTLTRFGANQVTFDLAVQYLDPERAARPPIDQRDRWLPAYGRE
jgi:hypothetical protein